MLKIDYWNSLTKARSWLFVPGHRPDRFMKAKTSGADYVVLDLEDSVGPDRKSLARENIDRWLAADGTGVVRINGTGSPWHNDDLAMINGRCPVMLPKAERAENVAGVVDGLGSDPRVLVILETALGIFNAREVCAVSGVIRAVFGNADLSTELGVDLGNHAALAHARSQVVLASAAAGVVPPIDGATAGLTDEEATSIDSSHALALGFTGKSCLHPRQVPVVNAAFSLSEDEIEWAKRIVAAAGDGSIGAMNSKIVGKPIFDRARRLLARAGLGEQSQLG